MDGCDGQHPSYNRGYNPRHFNHLKNSHNYTSKNPKNKSAAPQYLLNNNQHLNCNYLTKETYFNRASIQNKKVMNLIGENVEAEVALEAKDLFA